MLIYKLLGDEAQQSFARSWGAPRCRQRATTTSACVSMTLTFCSLRAGISYGLNAAAEWKSVLQEAAKAAVVLAILERLCLTRHENWLEVRWCSRPRLSPHEPRLTRTYSKQEHIDYLSLQSLMLRQTALGVVGQVKLLFRHQRRLAD
jgi:hypothetical protein